MSASELIAVVDEDRQRRRRLLDAIAQQGRYAVGTDSVTELCADGRAPVLVLLHIGDRAAGLSKAVKILRQSPETADAAIIALYGPTASAEVHVAALRGGADDALADSVAVDELDAHLQTRLRNHEAVAELRRQQRGVQMVLELTQALSSTLHIRDILFLVVQRIADAVRFDRVSIVLGGIEDDIGYVIAASDDRKLRDLPILLSDYPEIEKALETGQPLVIADSASEPLFELGHSDVPKRYRSLTLVPIMFEEKPLGVLFLRNHERRPVSESEMFLLRSVANATAVALRNARLLQSLRDQSRRSRFAHFEARRRAKSLQRYVDFFNSSADGIIVVDLRGRVLFCNPAACEITHRTVDELREGNFEQLLYADGRKRYEKLTASFALGVFPNNVDLPLRTPEGARRVLSVSFNSTLQEESGIIISMRDVTKERALARELNRTKEFLQRVIDSSVDAIVSADMKGRVLLLNPAAERIYGYDASEVVGRMNVRELYPDQTAVEVMKLIRSDERGGPGRLFSYRTELLGKDGKRIPVMLSAALIMHRGRPIVGVFTDLRAKLLMEARLAETEQELAVQEKKAVIAEIAGATAHELNQPLTSIMGYADLLVRQFGDDPRLREITETITKETERMAEIVRKIGKLTKYETKSYVGDAKILDLDRSVESEPQGGAR